jgi:hypothetical protein
MTHHGTGRSTDPRSLASERHLRKVEIACDVLNLNRDGDRTLGLADKYFYFM